MNYRRNFVPGGSFFFTVVTAGRRPILIRPDSIEVLRESFRFVQTKRPFSMDAAVILPDHLHCIWTLPKGDADFATRWRLIKTQFSRRCNQVLRGVSAGCHGSGTDNRVWQGRYWEHTLRSEADYIRHVEYIHYNPVKHGCADAAVDWPWSSFHRYVNKGVYPRDWGGAVVEFDGIGRE